MGKNKKGKKVDIEKKLALQAKKEAKQDRAARKRLSKQQQREDDDDEDDDETIDQVLQAYRRQHQKQVDRPSLEDLETEFPLPRANATLVEAQQHNDRHLYLFGGEYFDGVENVFLDELLRFDSVKRKWKQIWTFPRPCPRCAHSCVAYRHCLYVFGGEQAAAADTGYHHYRDLWKFDCQTLQWTELKAKNPPSARSGHVCWVWKQYMILFGGFLEAAKETRWYNDVHVFHLQTEQWMDVPQSRLSIKPEPRSACNVALYGTDRAMVHGGFAKVKSAAVGATNGEETKVHTDAWILHLAPLLQDRPPTWERWMASTKTLSNNSPNGRAGMSSTRSNIITSWIPSFTMISW
jgi:hypothetical protein